MTDNIVFTAGFVVLALACALIVGRALADLARRLPAENPEEAIWREAAREHARRDPATAGRGARTGAAPVETAGQARLQA